MKPVSCHRQYLWSLRPGDSVLVINPMGMKRRGKVISNDPKRGLRVEIAHVTGGSVLRRFSRSDGGTTRGKGGHYRIPSPSTCEKYKSLYTIPEY